MAKETRPPSATSWQRAQEEFYSKGKHKHLQWGEHSLYARLLAEQLCDTLGVTKQQTMLELGCGGGRFTPHLLRRLQSVTALDNSKSLLDALPQNAGPEVKLHVRLASVYDLPSEFPQESFDAVGGFFILHHLENIRACLAAAKSVLRRGGRIGFVEPNRRNPLFLLQVLCCPDMAWRGEKGLFLFNAARIMRLFDVVGFRDVRLKRFGFFPPQILDNWPRTLKFQQMLESVRPLYPLLPFVLISGTN